MIIPKNGKQKKQKIKKHYHVNKLQKRMREYDRNLPEDEKIMKKHYANNRNKHISDEEKIWETITTKAKFVRSFN